MNKAVQTMEKELQWPLEIRETEDGMCETSCDLCGKSHTFFLPTGEEQNTPVFARCLCHAWLAEKIHPLFSAVVVEGPEAVPEKVFENQIWPIFCVSRVWFADALMAKRFPEESRNEIYRKLDLIDKAFPDGQIKTDLSHTLQVALTLAEANRFWNIDRKPEGTIGEMTRTFLDIDPTAPCLESLKDLNDQLLKKHSTFSAELAENSEMGEKVWRIF